jgi:hypothetical protein
LSLNKPLSVWRNLINQDWSNVGWGAISTDRRVALILPIDQACPLFTDCLRKSHGHNLDERFGKGTNACVWLEVEARLQLVAYTRQR